MTTAQTSAPIKPWYKYPWPWILISVSVITLIVSFGLVWVAVANKDSEVHGDWYKDGKAINQDFARDDYASALTINAQLDFTGSQLHVTVSSRHPLAEDGLPKTLQLVFIHPSEAKRDVSVVLQRQADNSYLGQLNQPLNGHYEIELGCPAWRLSGMDSFPLASTKLVAVPPKG